MQRGALLALAILSCSSLLSPSPAAGQTFVERNTNAQGLTPPGEYRGVPAMQDNEVSCASNPLLPRNIICAWNASGGSDDAIGDTWIRISESLESQERVLNRYMNGSRLDPLNNVGQDFAADPITLCWPGGCGVIALAANRAPGGGTGGNGAGIYMQLMPDMNRETGFRHALATNLTPVYLSEPGNFADKGYATYILDEDDPGTVPVSISVDMPDGSTETVNRNWPKARIIVAFALGDPVGDEIKILSTYTDNYGSDWSTPVEVSSRGYWIDSVRVPNKCKKNPGKDECKELLPQGLNQGVNISAMGNTVLYAFRTFADADNQPVIKGVVSNDGGETISPAFDIVSPWCPYDVPTLPNAANDSVAAARTNSFPWLSHNGMKRILVYTERKLSSDGGCFTTFDAPTDSRIKAMIGSPDGKHWSAPVEIAPNPGHGFQFQPVVKCSLGQCLALWQDSRFDTARVENFLTEVSTNPEAGAALEAFKNLPVLGDFNFLTDATTGRVIQFRRTARVLATKIDISGAVPVPLDDPPAIVSKYRTANIDGSVRETQADGWNIKGYRTSTVPFMGDYPWLSGVDHRLKVDTTGSSSVVRWENNASFDPLTPDKQPFFWAAFTTSRNVVGDIFTARVTDPVPYTRTPDMVMADVGDDVEDIDADGNEAGEDANADEPMTAESVEDFNLGAEFCTPTGNPGAGVVFTSLNNRTKDFDIYGAVIEDRVSAFTFNPAKTFNIARTFTIVVENETMETRDFRLSIANQPDGAPASARASFDQLPFDPTDPDFQSLPPAVDELLTVDPMSSEHRPVFVVSAEAVNPVAVEVFEELAGGGERLINTITVNGAGEAGEFINADGSVNAFEIHNPQVFLPDEFSPDEFSPDEYSPDEFSPDVYSPDEFSPAQFNPDEFSPDEFSPDEFSPDEFSPDEFSPDEFSPDEFSPDEFSPDEFSAALIDEADLNNPEIPKPELGPAFDGVPLVAKKDINYALRNLGSTVTPYTFDFEVVDEEIQSLLDSGLLVAQVIVWQDKKINDFQFCQPRIVSENRIIAATTGLDLTELRVPDIANNSVGAATVSVSPEDIVQITIRFIAERSLLISIADRLTAANISSVFASQAANTGSTELIADETLLLDNRTPPSFPDFLPVDSTTFEAEGPLGVLLPADFIRAERDGDTVTVACDPALPAQIGLDILNVPPGPTPLTCTATTENGVTADLQLSVFVLDRQAPIIDAASLPADFTVEAVAGGTAVSYVLPTASDALGVDPNPVVACTPSSGEIFPFSAPGPTTTTVECVATDASGNQSLPTTFAITVEDTSAPVIADLDPPAFTPDLPEFVLGDNDATFQLQWGPFSVSDAGMAPTVSCTPGTLNAALSDASAGLYVFDHPFPAGSTDVLCTATDSLGQTSSATFAVTVFDRTPPTITLLGDAEVTIEVGETYVDAGVVVADNSTPDAEIDVDIDTSNVDTTAEGTYSVVISATDASNNVATATRTVLVEDTGYAGGDGIFVNKKNVKRGSSNQLRWAWLGEDGQAVDSSGDIQLLRIATCDTGTVVLSMAGDPGSSDFRFGSDNYWKFNWDTMVPKGTYCAVVESSLTGQTLGSPPVTVR